MTGSEGLNVVRRVPVAIIDDDGVDCSEIDPDPSNERAQKEYKSIMV
jgi:hypothetical protein